MFHGLKIWLSEPLCKKQIVFIVNLTLLNTAQHIHISLYTAQCIHGPFILHSTSIGPFVVHSISIFLRITFDHLYAFEK